MWLLTDFFLPVNCCAERNDDFNIIAEGQRLKLFAVLGGLREQYVVWYDVTIHYFFVYKVRACRRLKEIQSGEKLNLLRSLNKLTINITYNTQTSRGHFYSYHFKKNATYHPFFQRMHFKNFWWNVHHIQHKTIWQYFITQ